MESISLRADLSVAQLTVGGYVILVPVGTAAPVGLAVGSSVHVNGLLYPDGAIEATSITLLSS